METKTHHNSPAKCCNTCFHHGPESYGGGQFDKCHRFKMYCDWAMYDERRCGRELKEWKSKPPPKPRRSLRQWLYDLFIA